MALSKDRSKHENQPVTHWITNGTAKLEPLSRTDFWLFGGISQAGQRKENDYKGLHITLHLIFAPNMKLWPMPIMIPSSMAHTDIDGILPCGI